MNYRANSVVLWNGSTIIRNHGFFDIVILPPSINGYQLMGQEGSLNSSHQIFIPGSRKEEEGGRTGPLSLQNMPIMLCLYLAGRYSIIWYTTLQAGKWSLYSGQSCTQLKLKSSIKDKDTILGHNRLLGLGS